MAIIQLTFILRRGIQTLGKCKDKYIKLDGRLKLEKLKIDFFFKLKMGQTVNEVQDALRRGKQVFQQHDRKRHSFVILLVKKEKTF